MDSHFHGNDKIRSGDNPSEVRLHWASIKDHGNYRIVGKDNRKNR